MSAYPRGSACRLLLAVLAFVASQASAAFINFENCLDPNIVNSNPLQLQLVPLFLNAHFNTTAPSHNLNITVYGNVSGQATVGEYPPPDSPQWRNPNETFGKITNIGGANKYSTLISRFGLLTYNAYDAPAEEFCPTVVNGTCPLGPRFDANNTNPYDLPAFTLAHDFYSSYAFGTLAATVRIISGDQGAPDLACVSANITPDLGPRVSGLLTWLPAAILILKGLATLAAAIWSPWGSSDIFRWSSNYGRDEDLLRLVTPGFGDCLQYIQFVTLTGALSLQYPGFFQPAVSQTGWSVLMFNESFVSGGNGTQSLHDGIYVTNGTYGMTRMSQLIGLSEVDDIWACMAIWLLVVAACVVALCQLGFFTRWIYRRATDTTEEDLRRKNLPFTLGNMIRLMFNYFILPIVALSLYQLVVAPRSPKSVVACAVILLVLVIAGAGWILKVIFSTKPRTHLFDDMPTVLLYGPLYNTYSDSAAPFALIPVFITFMRGVAIGAVQPSGIAQLILLAICEVILILTLNAFRPFQNQTSMNAYHTFFSVVRLITILLSVAFVPSLGVTEGPKGWIGYAILLLHACVLVFGFFLNAAQTLIEVIARSLGVAGHDAQTGAVRGSILNMRMLKKRQDRPGRGAGDRGSMTSNAAILQDTDTRSAYAGARSRSMSASSQQLLNQHTSGGTMHTSGGTSVHRLSGFENFNGEFASSPGADETTFHPDGTPASALKRTRTNEGINATETFYRPPRQRKNTFDALSAPAQKSRKSGTSVDFPYADSPGQSSSEGNRMSSYEGAGFAAGAYHDRDSPAPAYFRDRADSEGSGRPRPDYAVREVDQYYGTAGRGPALSTLPTRKLKTGPADPEGPAASAQSWFQKLVFGVKGQGGGKKKEPSKGFEVVRSARMPPEMQRELEDGPPGEEHELTTSPAMQHEPYRDSPPLADGERQAVGGAEDGWAHKTAERAVSPVDDERSHDKTPQDRFSFGFGYDGASDPKPRAWDGPLSRIDNNGQTVDRSRPSSASTARQAQHPGVRAEQPRQTSLPRPSHETGASSRYDGRSIADTAASSRYDDGTSRGRPSTQYSEEPYRLNRASEAPSLGPIEGLGGSLDLPSRFNSRRSQNLNDVQMANTEGGHDWLRAVDALNWPSQGLADAPNTPGLPRRSSRRTPSADQTPAFGRPHPERRVSEDAFAGFDSTASPPEDRGNWLGVDQELERPTSFASVGHHRTTDSITRNSFGASQQGHSAEVFGRRDSHEDR